MGCFWFSFFWCPKCCCYFLSKAQILTTLPGHKASVNCTLWLPNSKFAFKAKQLEQHFLISGDAEGVIILWEYSLVDAKWIYVLQVPQAHKKGVTCITAIMVSQQEAVLASAPSDATVNVWEVVFPSTRGVVSSSQGKISGKRTEESSSSGIDELEKRLAALRNP